jgi:precorrin-6A/cobalt-precorrin-6A reductase
MPLNILILGGTSEASALAERLAGDARYAATLSLAGRTAAPQRAKIPMRVGGFGGADGLAQHLRDTTVDVLIDATHPFAEQISANAMRAAEIARIPLIVLARPAWLPVTCDRWTLVPDLTAAAGALPEAPARVFLTVGRQSLAPFAAKPQHNYLIRVIDPPDIPAAMVRTEIIVGRGPFEEAGETALLRKHRIEMLVTKNSGGKASAPKLAAARTLKLPVIMVERPSEGASTTVSTIDEVLAALAHHHASLAKRSE